MGYFVIFNLSTGEVVGDFRAEGNEHLKDDFLALGRGVLESGLPVDRDLFHAKYGILTPKTEVLLAVDKAEISADGSTQAVVTVIVAGKEQPANIDLLVAGTVETLNLTNGQGVLAPITAETPFSVEVAILDTITYRGGSVEIKAVEHG